MAEAATAVKEAQVAVEQVQQDQVTESKEKEKAPKAEKPAKKAKSEGPISIPAFNQELKLFTLQGQKVMRRVFARASISLYNTDVILRIIGNEEDAAKVEAVILTMFDEVDKALKEAKEQQALLLEENGIDEMPEYDSPVVEQVKIVSPQVARFVSMIRKLDKLIVEIDALWLSGVISNKERNDAVYRWQQRIIGLGSRIIGLERRAREAAQRQGKGDEVNNQAPASADTDNDVEKDVEAEKETA